MGKIRKPVVAGMFYPEVPDVLKSNINNYINQIKTIPEISGKLYGIISPHAGYPYSGPIAAYGFKLLQNHKAKKIIILAPSHREYFHGFSIFPGDSYETPLGQIPICKESEKILLKNPAVNLTNLGHLEEHSLEVQLPFLQTIYDHNYKIIPIVVGDCSISMLESFAETLLTLAEHEDFVIIASSDLSHYHNYDLAVDIDTHFNKVIESYNLYELSEGIKDHSLEACGIAPIFILMKYAELSGNPKCKILNYRNSGDTSGDKNQVVGYTSAVIFDT